MFVTVTVSEKVIVTLIKSPALYIPFSVVEETMVTVGASVSITMFLLFPSEPEAPGSGRPRLALLPERSFIVPSFRLKAVERL